MADICAKCGQVHVNGCRGHKADGSPCGRHPKKHTPVCRSHGGAAKQVIAKADERRLIAEAHSDLAALGIAIEVTPIEALEAMLFEAAGNVTMLRHWVADLGEDVYGELHHQTGVPTGEAKPHVLVVMYNEERDRLAKLAEACAKLGLDERRIRLAEAQARDLFEAVNRASAVLPDDVKLRFREALAHELRSRHPEPPR